MPPPPPPPTHTETVMLMILSYPPSPVTSARDPVPGDRRHGKRRGPGRREHGRSIPLTGAVGDETRSCIACLFVCPSARPPVCNAAACCLHSGLGAARRAEKLFCALSSSLLLLLLLLHVSISSFLSLISHVSYKAFLLIGFFSFVSSFSPFIRFFSSSLRSLFAFVLFSFSALLFSSLLFFRFLFFSLVCLFVCSPLL